MNTRRKIAFWCYAAAMLILAVFGIVYLFRPEFMPYHSVAVGMPWTAVDPSFQVLILALMRAVGGACLSLAVVQFVLLLVPFRQGAAWASWTIAVAGLVMCAGSLYAMMLVTLNTPATPPWFGSVWAPCSCSLDSWPHSSGAALKRSVRADGSRVPAPSAGSTPAAP